METKQSHKYQVGSRVYSGLYGGREGIIFKITGEQVPQTIQNFGGISMGGNAEFDVVFEDGSISRGIPESIVRGVQWKLREGVASADEIAQALNFAEAERVRKETEKALKDNRDAELRAKWLAKFGTWLTPTADNSCGGGKLAAKNIRKQLKKAFPGVKFSVTSDYSSVDVSWEFGPTTKAVDAIIDRYCDGETDITGDYRDYAPTVWTKLFGGAKYVNSHRRFSEGLMLDLCQQYCKLRGVAYNGPWTPFDDWDRYGVTHHVHELLGVTRLPVAPAKLAIVKRETPLEHGVGHTSFYEVKAVGAAL